jgi:hypothetical protein
MSDNHRTQYTRDRVHFHRFLTRHWEEAMATVELHKQFRKARKGTVKFTNLPLASPPGTLREIVPAVHSAE